VSGPARRWLVPEVVQSSAMDCGPASLKAVLEGYGVAVSYGRLREACQTDVDGTSIDSLEEVANQIGLDAGQTLVSADDLFLPESAALPGLLVVHLPSGLTHFVVAWRVHGLGGPFDERGWVQLMDPAEGRRWVSLATLRSELYRHEMPVPASAWRDFAATPAFTGPLRRRLRRLGVAAPDAAIADALTDPGWLRIAALDAAVRMTTAIASAGGVDAGPEAAALLEATLRGAIAAQSSDAASTPIPARFWRARPAPQSSGDEEHVLLSGAVVLSVSGVRPDGPAAALQAARLSRREAPRELLDRVPSEVAAALLEDPTEPWRHLWRMVREDGLLAPAAVAAALLVAALSVVAQSVALRGLFELSRVLGEGPPRLFGVAAVLGLLAAVLALEFPLALSLLRLGRRLEGRLRVAFVTKLPRLADRYFSSRPVFDMTERGHSVQQVRAMPVVAGQLLRAVAALTVTTAAITWISPGGAWIAVLAAIAATALPLIAQRPIGEMDLRYRTHSGALGRFYLDALLGSTAVRTHGAERSVRREHEALLVEWARAALRLARASVTLEGAEALVGVGLSVAVLLGSVHDASGSGSVLLLAYWALGIPALGAEVALLARQYPDHRNVAARLLEPLGAPDDPAAELDPSPPREGAAAFAFEGVSVRAGGHAVLDDVTISVGAGEHVAVVGRSGAGKSSLAGLLLGWSAPSSGVVRVDGEALSGPRLAALRRGTVWVDPSVQLWNRSLLDNLRYGTDPDAAFDLGDTIPSADLRGVIERLPDGMQTVLGEGGALVSGGEGQRVRFARGLLRPGARLVVLDEAFRGLDRDKRRSLLSASRRRWSASTLLCVSHDLHETLDFPRVLVIEDGRVVEDGAPQALADDPSSRYRALLDAEESLRAELWSATSWRRVRVEGGRANESPSGAGR